MHAQTQSVFCLPSPLFYFFLHHSHFDWQFTGGETVSRQDKAVLLFARQDSLEKKGIVGEKGARFRHLWRWEGGSYLFMFLLDVFTSQPHVRLFKPQCIWHEQWAPLIYIDFNSQLVDRLSWVVLIVWRKHRWKEYQGTAFDFTGGVRIESEHFDQFGETFTNSFNHWRRSCKYIITTFTTTTSTTSTTLSKPFWLNWAENESWVLMGETPAHFRCNNLIWIKIEKKYLSPKVKQYRVAEKWNDKQIEC